MDVAAIPSVLGTITGIIALFKEAKDLLPEGNNRTQIKNEIEQAERQIKLAESQIAKVLGYPICRCTFPPQIMLLSGQKSDKYNKYKCANCDREYPPEFEPPTEEESSWEKAGR